VRFAGGDRAEASPQERTGGNRLRAGSLAVYSKDDREINSTVMEK
jgi:hypothetical protein